MMARPIQSCWRVAAYWRGRAAEAAGQVAEMRAQYEAAARYPTAYYGQLARARLGLDDVAHCARRREPADVNANELLHAADILYQIGERDLVLSFVTDLADESSDAAADCRARRAHRAIQRCPKRCCSSARRRSREACRWTCTLFPTSACRL